MNKRVLIKAFYKLPTVLLVLILVFLLAGCSKQTTTPSSTSTTVSTTTIPKYDFLSYLMTRLELIVSGTVTDLRQEEESGHIFIIYTITVDKVIKGDPDTKVVYIKKQSNCTDTLYYKLDTNLLVGINFENNFPLGNVDFYYDGLNDKQLLIRIDLFIEYAGPTYYYPWGNNLISEQEVIGYMIAAMLTNDIPVALPNPNGRHCRLRVCIITKKPILVR